jgi:cytochrome P450
MKVYIQDKHDAGHDSQKEWKGSSGDILDLALLDPDYGRSASTSEIVDQLKTFFFAGHDTTASALSWSYYFLSHHPAELLRLRQELDEVFGINTTPSEVAKKFVDDPKLHTKLDFTLAVIKESLRLEPPAAPLREVPPNYHFKTSSGATFAPPEGTMIYLSAWMLHRSTDVWGDDAGEFKPERFMPGKPLPWGYIPFSKRPRDCIGSSLAYLEVRTQSSRLTL